MRHRPPLLILLLFTALAPHSLAQTVTQTAPYADLPADVAPVTFPAVTMAMTTPAGTFPMFIELALSQEQAMRGLMYRPELPDDYGMLFVFGDERPRSFWMRNTPSPLDIIYIRGDGVVDSVVQGTPLSQESLPSLGPARFVLEVRQGLAEVYGLTPGARVLFE